MKALEAVNGLSEIAVRKEGLHYTFVYFDVFLEADFLELGDLLGHWDWSESILDTSGGKWLDDTRDVVAYYDEASSLAEILDDASKG